RTRICLRYRHRCSFQRCVKRAFTVTIYVYGCPGTKLCCGRKSTEIEAWIVSSAVGNNQPSGNAAFQPEERGSSPAGMGHCVSLSVSGRSRVDRSLRGDQL